MRLSPPPPLPADIDQIATQGRVEGEVGGTPFSIQTDDPTGPGAAPRPTVTPVDAAPDLHLTKTGGDGPVTPGEMLSYTLTYTNVGTQTATGVVLRETVPANTVFAPATSDVRWRCTPNGNAGNPCRLRVGALAVGQSASVAFAVTVANPLPVAVTHLTNIASIVDDGTQGRDLNPDDNRATRRTPVTSPLTTADLVLTKTASADPVLAGNTLIYALIIRNRGPASATTVAVTDTLPPGTTLITVQPPSPTCTAADQTVTCTLGTLAAGASATVTLSIQVDASAPSQLMNQASVSAAETDPVAGNNTATVSTMVNHLPQALNDTATTPIRTAVTIDVLANDTDADGDPLTVARVTQGANGGRVTVAGDAVTYTPARDFTGTDRFRYTVGDGRGGQATAQVTVTVTAAAVDLLTPRDQQIVAGQTVPVAAFIVPEELQEIIASMGGVVSLPEDTETVVFQFRPEGSTAWQDIGTADTPPSGGPGQRQPGRPRRYAAVHHHDHPYGGA